jgi:hypothetical protein
LPSCWSEPFTAGIFGGPGSAILKDMGYTVLSIDVREISNQDLINQLKDHDVVPWWNWNTPNIQPDALAEIRTLYLRIKPGVSLIGMTIICLE